MVQADKENVEDLGLLKLDVLGVRMQSAMAYAVAEIRRTTGRLLDLDNPDHVNLNDQQAFEMIRASDTIGLFQLESPGQQDLVGLLQPRHTPGQHRAANTTTPLAVRGSAVELQADLTQSTADRSGLDVHTGAGRRSNRTPRFLPCVRRGGAALTAGHGRPVPSPGPPARRRR